MVGKVFVHIQLAVKGRLSWVGSHAPLREVLVLLPASATGTFTRIDAMAAISNAFRGDMRRLGVCVLLRRCEGQGKVSRVNEVWPEPRAVRGESLSGLRLESFLFSRADTSPPFATVALRSVGPNACGILVRWSDIADKRNLTKVIVLISEPKCVDDLQQFLPHEVALSLLVADSLLSTS